MQDISKKFYGIPIVQTYLDNIGVELIPIQGLFNQIITWNWIKTNKI